MEGGSENIEYYFRESSPQGLGMEWLSVINQEIEIKQEIAVPKRPTCNSEQPRSRFCQHRASDQFLLLALGVYHYASFHLKADHYECVSASSVVCI